MKRNGSNRAMMSSKAQMPRGWRLVRLGDVAEINPRRPPLSVPAETPVTFLPMAAIAESSQGIVARESRPYSEVSTGYTYFEENDFLFSKITPCLQNGKHTLATGLRGGFGFGTTEFHVVRTSSILTAPFMFRALTQAHIIDRCSKSFTGTAGQQRVQPETLKDLPVLLPPLPEQRAIAAVLDSIDDAIERTEAVIAATERLRDSLLHQLLTRGVPGWHTEWKDVPGLGTIPADWEVVKLGGVAEVKGGKRLPKGSSYADRNTGLPYIRVVDFHDRTVDTDAIQYLSPEIHKVISNYTISSKDVYISIAGTIGLVGTVPTRFDGANLTENAAKIAIHDCEQLSQTFLVAFLDSSAGQSQIAIRVTMLGQPKLALERIKTIELPLPPLPEQQAIAATLDGVDATLEKTYRERDGLGLLKESTADALLMGRVRVGKLMNEQDSMSDLSEATLWDARQVTARRFESIAVLNQPVFPPGLMKSIAVLNRPVFLPGLMKSIAALNRPVFLPGLMKSIAALNQPVFLPGLMKSIAALNQPVFPPGLMKSIAVLNRPVFLPGLMKSIAALNQPVFLPGLMKSIAALNQPVFPPGLMKSIAVLNRPVFLPGLMKSIAALNQPVFPPGLMKSIAALNQPVFPPGLMKSIAALNQPGATLPTAEYDDVLDVRALPNDLTDGNLALDRIVLGDDSEWLWLIFYDYQITDPDLRRISRKLFADGHYAIAVERAYVYLNNLVKDKAGLGDEDGVALMNRTFSPKNPILKLSSLSSTSERDEQLGYMQILTGVMLGIRNPRVHEHEINDTPQEALEMLGLANHLARKVIGAMR